MNFWLTDGYSNSRDIEYIQMKKPIIILITIGFLPLFVSCGSQLLPTKLDSPQLVAKSFTQWCEEKSNLPAASKLTVDILLKEADTEDCKLANTKLQKLTQLDLYHSNISNLEPIAGFTNLISLDLIGNQITDIKPLAGLTNLTYLALAKNQITDVKPLAGLINLTYLSLSENQISDFKSLASLINLKDLKLFDNKVVGEKICPVEAYVCNS
jgi:internalin A